MHALSGSSMPRSPEDLLHPRPKRVRWTDGELTLAVGAVAGVVAEGTEDSRATRHLVAELRALGTLAREGGDEARFVLRLAAGSELPAGGYRLTVDSARATILAGDLPGLFHGACTLAQLARADRFGGAPAAGGRAPALVVPGVEIEDAPDFPHRGVMLDVSRDRVPTMETLFAIVDRLAGWKLNQLQLYMEHTFAYEGHETVWKDASPFTADEIRALDAYCIDRHIELVPNLNCFGHMHRWLKHDAYRSLAECPEGVDHPFAITREPFSLCATDPASLAFIAELLDGLLPAFTSDQVNVGLDETIDLGLGRSRAACDARGKGRVYLDYLAAVHGLVAARGKRMQFWGDIIVEYPDLVPALPRDAIAMEWGYEAGHPFAQHAAQFATSGLPFYVVPGTSSWLSITGRIPNAAANLEEAARHGLAAGAVGYLVADWGDYGHWQSLAVTWPGLLLGAGRAWNAGAGTEALADLLAHHVLHDPTGAAGRALVALGSLYLASGAHAVNGSPECFLLRFAHEPFPHPRIEGLTLAGIAATEAAIEAALTELEGHAMRAPDAALIADELRFAADLTAFACRLGRLRIGEPHGAMLASAPPRARAALAGELRPLIGRYRALWPRRSRPGGLDDSAGRLEHVAQLLAPGADGAS